MIIIGKLIIGGAERVGRDIGYYADKKKYRIHYLVFENDICAYEKELTNAGCIIHHMDPPSFGYVRYYRNLCELIKKQRIDIIHAHTMFNSGGQCWQDGSREFLYASVIRTVSGVRNTEVL